MISYIKEIISIMDSKDLESLTAKFSKHSKYAVIRFADAVRKSNLYCDMKTYQIWKHVEMENNLKDVSMKKEEIIDSNLIEQCEKLVDLTNISINNVEGSDIQSLTDEDVATSLKEHFKFSNHIPSQVIEILLKSSPETIGKIFMNLSESLNSEQILMFGESLEIHLDNDLIMEYFCRCLLLKMTTVFTEDLKVLFLRLCSKFDSKLISHITTTIENNDKVEILSLYLNSMESLLQESLLCELLGRHTNFTGKYIFIAKCLIHKNMKYNTLKKLMEIMANNVEQYSTDKEYGNLLFQVVTYLEKDSSSLEHILRHILNNHKSIWKAKLQKTLPITESQEF